MRKVLAVVLGAALLTTVSGCGGGGGRPSSAEISASLQQEARTGSDAILKGSIDKHAADCMGQVLHDSDLSDDALRAVVDGDEKYDASKADKQAMAKVAPDFVNCIPEMKQLKDQLGQLTGTPQP
jgi:hypothetical protein